MEAGQACYLHNYRYIYTRSSLAMLQCCAIMNQLPHTTYTLNPAFSRHSRCTFTLVRLLSPSLPNNSHVYAPTERLQGCTLRVIHQLRPPARTGPGLDQDGPVRCFTSRYTPLHQSLYENKLCKHKSIPTALFLQWYWCCNIHIHQH